jgi:hypothetical protein
MGGRYLGPQFSVRVVEGVAKGVMGVVGFVVVENGPGALQRRRMSRSSLSKRRY